MPAQGYVMLPDKVAIARKHGTLYHKSAMHIQPKSVSWMSHAEARRGRERRERYHYQVELKLCRE